MKFPKKALSLLFGALTMVSLSVGSLSDAAAAEKSSFKVAWSIYVGWMPWGYAADNGIVKKWADKYGIDIEVVQINDYIESINQYTAGGYDACVMTNMDALTIPAAGGVDSTALILGDFSNGNDAVILKGKDKLPAIKGQNVNLVELSVSHYLLARGLESVGLSEKDIKVVNTSDADMVAAYTTSDVTAVTTWNPLVAEITAMPGAHKVFDSAQIPGEIIDMLVANSEVVKDNPKFAKALVGAWFETMALMSGDNAAGKVTRAAMGKASGTDLAGYEMQLASTKMFYQAADSLAFAKSADLPATMDKVRKFSFDHGLLGDGAPSPDVIGMAFPGGKTLGDTGNIKLRFDDTYVGLAAKGAL
ncbi:MAG: putative urea ABC transporter substrate-binding protein [Alphaproteobacteria bacterium]|jgi:NitT/TauT family transport system substrate-binding protein|nr:putative urea ABC transporter substrate-binding protein [Alphaproteobacteria bacterium]|tara:strand:- start:3181 stop:4263 length:1083 start_codon:yes stop_codon:yes gene_type:complete